MPDHHSREQAIFEAARNIADTAARQTHLQQACAGDATLLERVTRLLAAYEEGTNFLELPPSGLGTSASAILPPAERPGATIGPYTLLETIGEGGMGIVYRAAQKEPVKRLVALKIIKPGLDSRQVIARFEAERQALGLMDHPNIAKVLDAGTTELGRPYFVMELVDGVPITRYCDEAHLGLQPRLELIIPVCQAIQHAHQKGIIHRDIKPSNVLVAQYDGRPVPKVIDFGVAKATQTRSISEGHSVGSLFTHLGQIVGTLEYMSPEQAELEPRDIDTRSDIYSLGVLLYELLTGCTPFDKQRFRASAFHEMLRIIREDEPPTPSTRLSTIDALPSIAALRSIEPTRLTRAIRGELDWIVMKALEKDKSRRYDSASNLALDLQRHLADEPVQACPPSTVYRLGKFIRRHKTLLTTVSVIALALLASTAVSSLQAARAIRAESLAKENEARAIRGEESAKSAAEAEAAHRLKAEEQTRLVENQRQLLENNDRINTIVTNEILSVLRDIPTPASKRRQLLATALSRLGDLDPAERVKALNSAGSHFVTLGDYDSAINAFNEGLSLDPQSALIYVARGDVFFRQKEFDKALCDYTAAVKNRRTSDPTHLLPYTRRGLAHCQLGQFDQAITDFRASYDESPRPSFDLMETVVRGNFLIPTPLDKQLHEPIAALFDRYVTDQKQSAAARLYAADRLAEIKLYEASRKHLQADEAAGTKGPLTHYRLGLLALERGDTDDYRRVCRAALDKAAGSSQQETAQAWVNTVNVCVFGPSAFDDYSALINLARRALAKQPTSAYCRYALAAAQFRSGQFEQARLGFHASLESKVDQHGDHIWGPYLLAATYHHLGRPGDAKRWLENADARARSSPYYNWRFQHQVKLFQREATQLVNSQPDLFPPPDKN